MPIDPLAEIVTLLHPAVRLSKLVECAGPWRIHRPGTGEPFYCAVLEGECRIAVGNQLGETLQAGDFMLVPAMHDLCIESMGEAPAGAVLAPIETAQGRFRFGPDDAPVSFRMGIGHCSFATPDAALLVQLLPQLIVARGENRLATLMQLLDDETRSDRPARDLILERLLEVLLIEAFRCCGETAMVPGIARGLADERLSAALRALHEDPGRPWTVLELATKASLSRSAFFARFSRMVGLPPMEYLLAWRMALAQRLLRAQDLRISEIAERVGYGSTSTFTTAFTRHVGVSPARYGRLRPGADQILPTPAGLN